jgi:3-oxoacyl-[acyl-carrier-protein] synthase II
LLCADLCLGIVKFQGKTRAVALEPVQEVTIKKKLPTKQRRVVVTGLGVVTPLGHDPDVFYNNLLNGVSGISEIENFDCAEFPTVSYI